MTLRIYLLTMLSVLLVSDFFAVDLDQNKLDSLMLSKAYDAALDYMKDLEKQAKKENHIPTLADVYGNMAKIYYQKGNYNKSIGYFEKELELRKESIETEALSEAYFNLGSTCLRLEKDKKAQGYFENSLNLAKSIKDEGLIRAGYNALIIVSEKNKDYKGLSDYLKAIMLMNEGVLNSQIDLYKKEVVNQKQIVNKTKQQLNTAKVVLDTVSRELERSEVTIDILEEDTLRKQQQISSLNFQKLLKEYQLKDKATELEMQKKLTMLLVIGLVVFAVLGIVVFVLMISKRRLSKRLKIQNDQIEKQNDAITHSIEYASKIQRAALPEAEMFEKLFDDHFIYFRPRDIVSGDFYFLQKVNQYIVLAAVDCTGHGVPGAFMSMLGIASLNDIIRRADVRQANYILDILRNQVKTSLKQTGKTGEQKDGMDMAVCVINTETMEMQYAGAHNPLLIIRNGQMTELKADRMPVGIHRKETPFTNQVMRVQKGDQIYLFSDGFADQIGGESKDKFKSKTFKALIEQNAHLKMPEQHRILEQTYIDWRGNYNAIDDIVVIGVKL
ncbi:MAG: SpoIIE family protein phosphatase [Bacteroidales bacterium]|nr:SpoIIE family protein phosphatase [Bacteroidales bacterium]